MGRREYYFIDQTNFSIRISQQQSLKSTSLSSHLQNIYQITSLKANWWKKKTGCQIGTITIDASTPHKELVPIIGIIKLNQKA